MTAIGKGDFVEAVRNEHGPGASLLAGRVYVVLSVQKDFTCDPCPHCGNDEDCVEVEGARLLDDWAWCPCDFRPVYRPKPDAFADLLKAPTDAPTREHVAA